MSTPSGGGAGARFSATDAPLTPASAQPPALPIPLTPVAVAAVAAAGGDVVAAPSAPAQPAPFVVGGVAQAPTGVAIGGEALGPRGGNTSFVAGGGLGFRERAREVYFAVPWSYLHAATLVATLLLLLLPAVARESARTPAYHATEAIVVVLFAAEIAAHIFFQGSRYFESWGHCAEVVVCVFCIGSFFWAVGEERDAALAIRSFAQLMRLSLMAGAAIRVARRGGENDAGSGVTAGPTGVVMNDT